MKVQWRGNCDCTTLEKAKKVFAWLQGGVGRPFFELKIEPHHERGFIGMFSTEHSCGTWAELVLEVIALGQKVGYRWTITGDICRDAEGSSPKLTVPGMTFLTWWCRREE